MAALRCPKCGAIVVAEDRPPARCRHCHEPLHRCRYCRYFDTRSLACIHPEILPVERVIDPDEVRSCSYFDYAPKTQKVLRNLFGLSLHVWWAIITSAAIFALLYIGLGNKGPSAGEVELTLDIQEAGTVVQDEPFSLIVNIRNEGDQTAKGVTVRLGKQALQTFTLVGCDPLEQEAGETQDSIYLNFGDISAGEARLINFTFQSQKIGQFTMRFLVFADNSNRPKAEETRVFITH
jgi:hypothetical protein